MNSLASFFSALPALTRALAGPVRWLFGAAVHTAADNLTPSDWKRIAVAAISFAVTAFTFAAQVNNVVAYVFATLATVFMTLSHAAARFLEPPADMTKSL